nr:OmpA family protein [Moraxella osloensis]
MLNEVLDKINSEQSSDDDQWLPVSDLMSGLMILFLFIAISLILETQKVAQSYEDNQQAIYKALVQEFEQDLEKMGAEIDPKTLTFIFKSPDILFETGKSNLKPSYQQTLNDFFPRYMKVIYKYKGSIQEIRIEGHTSSEWAQGIDENTAYFENMRLSQDRTRAVLQYVYYMQGVNQYRPWIKENLAAVGLSSSKIIKDQQNKENRDQSKRVTFRIITNADEQLEKLAGEYSR